MSLFTNIATVRPRDTIDYSSRRGLSFSSGVAPSMFWFEHLILMIVRFFPVMNFDLALYPFPLTPFYYTRSACYSPGEHTDLGELND